MDLYLFGVIIKLDGKNQQVCDGVPEKPAIYTSSKEAWDYAKRMQELYPDEDYQVIQKRVTFEIN